MKTKLLGKRERGLVFVVSAPAGTGKTTLVEMLVQEFPEEVVRSISFTTRPKRPGEVSGVHYFFISEKEFEEKIAQRDFLEYAKIYGNYYGTSYNQVQKLQEQGKDVVLVIDTQGALQLKGRIPAVFVFLMPPSAEVLRDRLTQRQTESQTVIEERLEWSKKELDAVREYDYCIINDDLITAYQVLRSIVIAEAHKINSTRGQHARTSNK